MTLNVTTKGSGYPLIFVHAFPLDGRMWDENVDAVVDAGFCAIVPDLAGFGRSLEHPEVSSMEYFADRLYDMLIQNGISEAIFCGLSMGGYTLLALLRKHPQVFKGIVLCDTTANADTPEKRVARSELAMKVEQHGNSFLVEEILPNLVSVFTLDRKPDLMRRLSSLVESQPTSGVCAALRGMAERPDSNDALGTVSFPVKLIFGADDAVTGPDAATEMQAAIATADLTFVADAGHYSNMEAPDVFNRHLITYIKSLDLNN